MKTPTELYEHAMTYYGIPYLWGGEGPRGYDCSGLVQAILKFAGVDPKGDQTADGLFRYFLANGTKCEPQLAALAFYGKPERAWHVGFCLDTKLMINAAGGSAHIKSIEQAKKENAYVKVQPVSWHPSFLGCLMPRY